MPSNKRSQKFDEGSSKNCFCSQEYLIHKNDHNLSYSSSLANFRNHVLYHTEQPIKKTLKESDVSVNLNRLFLSKTEVEQYFLPMLKDDENVKDGVEVCAYDDYGNVYSLVFKMWADKYYVLNGEWKTVFKHHKLQCDDVVTTWMFRHSKHTKLCVAIEFQKIKR